MKSILIVSLFLSLVGCQSAKKRAEGMVTCLETNRVYSTDYVRHGYICDDKVDPSQRVFNDVDVNDGK